MTNIVSTYFGLILICFFVSSHPMILSMLVLSASLAIYVFLSQVISSWTGMALMLIFLGGMMIIFLYLTSLASSEKFFLNKKMSVLMIFFMGFGLFINYTQFWESAFAFENFKELYFFEKFLILVLIISYLLTALVLMVKISENFKGSLTKQF